MKNESPVFGIIIIVLFLVYYFSRLTKTKEYFSLIFYGEDRKKITIPKSYPTFRNGPCLRKGYDGSVEWGILHENGSGKCVSASESKSITSTTKPITPDHSKPKNSMIDAQGNLKVKSLNQMLGLTKDTDGDDECTVCNKTGNLSKLNDLCQAACSSLGENVGIKEISDHNCITGDKKGICGANYYKGNLLPNGAKIIGCSPSESDFNRLCQNKFGRRTGYKSLNSKSCRAGYKWAECSDRYYNGLPVYDSYLPQTTADIDTDDNPNVILNKTTECMRDNQITKFQEGCAKFGEDWQVSGYVGGYCKPGYMRALCVNSQKPIPTPLPNKSNGTGGSGTNYYTPGRTGCPC